MKRSWFVYALIALSLGGCKLSNDVGDGFPHSTVSNPAATGGTGGGGPSGSSGQAAAAGNGSAGMGTAGKTGSGGIGSAGMGSAGKTGAGGIGSAGMGSTGMTATGGMGSAGMGGSGGVTGTGGMGSAGASGGDGETGRNVGMTAAHNAVRANASDPTPNPALPPLTWSADVAKIAQAYAEKLAASCDTSLVHSMRMGFGENLAAQFGGPMTAQQAVDGWASEKMCWTYGNFGQTDVCDETCAMQVFSNGCGHYTQLVWRDTTQVGCGVASCGSGAGLKEYWVCNYTPQGNVVYSPVSRPPY